MNSCYSQPEYAEIRKDLEVELTRLKQPYGIQDKSPNADKIMRNNIP